MHQLDLLQVFHSPGAQSVSAQIGPQDKLIKWQRLPVIGILPSTLQVIYDLISGIGQSIYFVAYVCRHWTVQDRYVDDIYFKGLDILHHTLNISTIGFYFFSKDYFKKNETPSSILALGVVAPTVGPCVMLEAAQPVLPLPPPVAAEAPPESPHAEPGPRLEAVPAPLPLPPPVAAAAPSESSHAESGAGLRIAHAPLPLPPPVAAAAPPKSSHAGSGARLRVAHAPLPLPPPVAAAAPPENSHAGSGARLRVAHAPLPLPPPVAAAAPPKSSPAEPGARLRVAHAPPPVAAAAPPKSPHAEPGPRLEAVPAPLPLPPSDPPSLYFSVETTIRLAGLSGLLTPRPQRTLLPSIAAFADLVDLVKLMEQTGRKDLANRVEELTHLGDSDSLDILAHVVARVLPTRYVRATYPSHLRSLAGHSLDSDLRFSPELGIFTDWIEDVSRRLDRPFIPDNPAVLEYGYVVPGIPSANLVQSLTVNPRYPELLDLRGGVSARVPIPVSCSIN